MSPTKQYLYRYLNLNGENNNRAKDLFDNNRLFFVAPSSFNDPFDCRLKMDFTGTNRQWDEYLTHLIELKAPNLTPFEKQAQLKGMRKQRKTIDFTNNVLKSLKDEIGVLCLSEVNDSILMWSHYSDGHKGFCLRFDFSKHNEYFGRALKLNYESVYPKINFFGNTKQEKMEAMILTKADVWYYEKEWRIIEHDNGPGYYYFPKECLSGLIFGAEISNDDKSFIKRLTQQNKYNLKYFQSNYLDREYAVSIDEV